MLKNQVKHRVVRVLYLLEGHGASSSDMAVVPWITAWYRCSVACGGRDDAEDNLTLSAAISAALSDVPLDNLDHDE